MITTLLSITAILGVICFGAVVIIWLGNWIEAVSKMNENLKTKLINTLTQYRDEDQLETLIQLTFECAAFPLNNKTDICDALFKFMPPQICSKCNKNYTTSNFYGKSNSRLVLMLPHCNECAAKWNEEALKVDENELFPEVKE